MAGRILLAGSVGGIVMFGWISLAQISPLGDVGISALPRETFITETLAGGAGGTGGFYMFPASSDAPPTRPSGILVFDLANMRTHTAVQYAAEFAKTLVQALLLAVLLAHTRSSGFVPRLGVCALAGGIVAMTTLGSYVIWYGFPLSYVFAQGAIVFLAYVLAGGAMARLLPSFSKDATPS